MEQIKALDQKPADYSGPSPEPIQASDIFSEPATAVVETRSEPAQVILPPPANDAPLHLRQYDVVQVYDRESSHYGVLFQVGDVRGSKVHGYYLQTKGDKVYVTFTLDQLRLIGTARVRSKVCCSPKWLSDHNAPQQ